MIYAVKKFRHYLLANHFVFFVDHQALLYLVNKPCAIGRIVRWFVILLEFDFTVAVKKGSTHKRADHVSRIANGEAPIGVDDDIPDATLFKVEIVPRWSESIVQFLSTASFESQPETIQARAQFLHTCRNFKLISGRLYHLGSDQILRLVANPQDYRFLLQEAHVGISGHHFSKVGTIRRVLCEGHWWPTLHRDAVQFLAHNCKKCRAHPSFSHSTLYQMTQVPSWSDNLVKFLATRTINKDLPLHRRRKLKLEARSYQMIKDNSFTAKV